jgi:hypothetical protein
VRKTEYGMQREREKNRDRKWARERMREGHRIMKEEVYRIIKIGFGKEKGRDRGTELVRQEEMAEEKIRKDKQF